MPILVAVAGLILVQRQGYPALVVIAVWQHYETASSTVEGEANELAGIYFFASQLPDSDRTHIQGLGRTYAEVVVQDEWPMMEEGKTSARTRSCTSSG